MGSPEVAPDVGATPPASRPDLIWEEAKRLLARQETSLDALRAQALGMLSVAAVVAGLFGGHVVATHHARWQSGFAVAALVLFGVTAAVVTYIEVPRSLVFSYEIGPWIADIHDGRPILAEDIAYNLGGALDRYRVKNALKMAPLRTALVWICVLVGVQVVIWGAAAI